MRGLRGGWDGGEGGKESWDIYRVMSTGFFFGKVEVVLSLDFRPPGGLGDDLLGRYRS